MAAVQIHLGPGEWEAMDRALSATPAPDDVAIKLIHGDPAVAALAARFKDVDVATLTQIRDVTETGLTQNAACLPWAQLTVRRGNMAWGMQVRLMVRATWADGVDTLRRRPTEREVACVGNTGGAGNGAKHKQAGKNCFDTQFGAGGFGIGVGHDRLHKV